MRMKGALIHRSGVCGLPTAKSQSVGLRLHKCNKGTAKEVSSWQCIIVQLKLSVAQVEDHQLVQVLTVPERSCTTKGMVKRMTTRRNQEWFSIQSLHQIMPLIEPRTENSYGTKSS